MASVAKVWNINWDGFPNIPTKRNNKVSVGFEWEIENPVQYDGCDCDHGDGEYCDRCDEDEARLDSESLQFADTHGFRIHAECGGAEFASPVFRNLGTARAMASRIKAMSFRDTQLDPYETNGCGIHVHTGFTGWSNSARSFQKDYETVTSMLNRASSTGFILEFSGRSSYHNYYKQANSTCWDEKSSQPTEEQLFHMRDREMVRPNGFSGISTIEYRIWNGTQDRLQPAIDFAHACTTFITKRGDSDIPYLKDFKVWLDKQAGYKVLKQDPAWSLV